MLTPIFAASQGLHTLDWGILVLYLVGTFVVGASFYKGQKTTKDFFLAGRSMSWFPVGLSVVATLFSAVSYIALPSVNQKYGLVFLTGTIAVFLCIPIVTRIFMPFYNKLQCYSAYEYLEKRFDVRVRCLASGLFILWRIVWMSTAVYAPSLALWAATGGRVPLIPTIVILGILATIYTMLGGMKAVIWTDAIQFVVLFGGMILAIAFILAKIPGGLGAIWDTAQASGKTDLLIEVPGMAAAQTIGQKMHAYFFMSNERCTMLAIVISSFIGHVGFYTVDQATVQRYFTAKSLKDSRKSFWVNAIGNVSLHVGLAFLGMALLLYFKHNPMPTEIEGVSFKTDWGFPYFAATALPAGVGGLILAALYAATMSSVDSGINSCTTAYMVDFWKRLKNQDVDSGSEGQNQEDLKMARRLTLLLGLFVTVIACFVGQLGSIIVIASKLVNGFCGPMFVIFIMGMFTRRAKSLGVAYGALLSLGIMWYLTFFSKTQLNFKWTVPFGFVVSFASCYGLSLYQDFLGWLGKRDRRLFDLFSLLSIGGTMIAIVVFSPSLGIFAYLLALLAAMAMFYFYAESADLKIDPEKFVWTYREQRKLWDKGN